MPIIIKRAETRANLPATFDFDAPIVNYVVGVAYWNFSFSGDDDHHVKTIELSLDNNKPHASQVQSFVRATLRDEHGASIDNSASTVHLVCIAESVVDDGNIAMANIENVASGSLGGSLPMPGTNTATGQAFLSGWSVTYPVGDHHVKLFELAVGFAASGTTGQISSLAKMSDDTGKSASGTIDGGLVATNLTQRGLLVRQTGPLQTTGAVNVDFGAPIKEGGAIIQRLRLSYDREDHHVDTIGGGSSGWTVSGNSLVLTNARAFMQDRSNHRQDNDLPDSHVTLAVFAVPA